MAAARSTAQRPNGVASVGAGLGIAGAGGQKQGDFSGQFRTLLVAETFHIFFQRGNDRGPVVAMAGNGVPHPTVEQSDKGRRGHETIFKIEELLNISTPS